MKALLLLPPLAAVLAACAQPAATAPLHYPALPAAAAKPPLFSPATARAPLALPCRAEEPALTNALDDDCDGRIDDAPSDATLLALAYPNRPPIALLLRTGDRLLPLPTEPCLPTAPFCTTRLHSQQLPSGPHTLLARWTAQAADTAPPALLVSVQSHGKVTSYALPGEASEAERVVGELNLP